MEELKPFARFVDSYETERRAPCIRKDVNSFVTKLHSGYAHYLTDRQWASQYAANSLPQLRIQVAAPFATVKSADSPNRLALRIQSASLLYRVTWRREHNVTASSSNFQETNHAICHGCEDQNRSSVWPFERRRIASHACVVARL
jgi:hypothetical protein